MQQVKRQLAAADADRLARLLGMIGSQHDGEALNAARLADRLVRDRGLRWPDVLTVPTQVQPAEPAPVNDADPFAAWPGGWRQAVAFVLRHAVLTDWERQFATKISSYVGECSGKQKAILLALCDRAIAAGARAA